MVFQNTFINSMSKGNDKNVKSQHNRHCQGLRHLQTQCNCFSEKFDLSLSSGELTIDILQ